MLVLPVKKTSSPQLESLNLSFSLLSIFLVPLKTFCNFLSNKLKGVAGVFELAC